MIRLYENKFWALKTQKMLFLTVACFYNYSGQPVQSNSYKKWGRRICSGPSTAQSPGTSWNCCKMGSNCRIPRWNRGEGEGFSSTRKVSLGVGSENEAICYVLATCGGWNIGWGNFLWAGYASTRGYASKLKLRVFVFVVFCRGCWIIERGNFLWAGYASTPGYGSKLMLRVLVFVVFCWGSVYHRTRHSYGLATRLRVATRLN